jgi:outer membrane lipopolysaccharide assembly protein LptE/RlpB
LLEQFKYIYHQLTTSIIILVLTGCLLSTPGCGYHFSGGGQLPENVTKICVQVFENKTSESGLEHTIANEIINYVTRFENLKLVGKEEAQATLTGVVQSSSISTIAHKSSYVSSERRIKIVVDVKLNSSKGELLWKSGPTSEDETFQIDPDKMQTDENKKSALAKISKKLAERIYYRLTDNF